MSRNDNQFPEDVSLDTLTEGRAGARARALQVARQGLPHHRDLSERRKELAQYRAAISLLWDRERILLETGWSLQKLMAVENMARDEAKRVVDEIDPRVIYEQYRTQQLQACAELENLAEAFKKSSQHNALVAAVKARSEILDRIVKMGQELGLIKRAAHEVEIHAKVDLRQLSIAELRVQLAKEVRDLKSLLEPPRLDGVADTVAQRVLAPPTPAAVAAPKESAREKPVTAARAPRVRKAR
jgi:hypothetical protein